MAAKICRRPGCRGLVRDGACSVCGPVSTSGWKAHGEQGTRQERGYDAAWYRLRAAVIEERLIEGGGVVICELCGRPIVGEPIHADHRVPFRGLADPLRLDPGNVRLSHETCHMRHTARGARRRAD
jgi:hypothetical protein